MQISESNNNNDSPPYMRHRNRTACNIAFVDGHAESVILPLAPPGKAPNGTSTLPWTATPGMTPVKYQVWYAEYVNSSGAPQWPNTGVAYNQNLPTGWARNPMMPLHWSQLPKLYR
jgi:prepilin-type processing-associated H-X9-DG protein